MFESAQEKLSFGCKSHSFLWRMTIFQLFPKLLDLQAWNCTGWLISYCLTCPYILYVFRASGAHSVDPFWCTQCIVNEEKRRHTGPLQAHKIQTVEIKIFWLLTFNRKGFIPFMCEFEANTTNALGEDRFWKKPFFRPNLYFERGIANFLLNLAGGCQCMKCRAYWDLHLGFCFMYLRHS